ncbi:hypothetical protein THAOC_23954 [Thalassiosira oceanica]|uniref:Uncharacterized protein n=1 Tax=Thalassiosira oceanica TaxID=159749 RepID=K0RR46_THAOC|nr:hypothetical protein THAOC_23954 [Thalassiosira oceanica]|eukprot:EJK56208.1 hypothetical protein THAOC_23954 [Thalassiosira oceanica]
MKIEVPDRLGKWLYKEPSARGSRNGSPKGPGRPAKKARKACICQSALCRQHREPRRTSDRAVGRTLDEGRREWDEKQLPGKLSPSSASRSGSSNPGRSAELALFALAKKAGSTRARAFVEMNVACGGISEDTRRAATTSIGRNLFSLFFREGKVRALEGQVAEVARSAWKVALRRALGPGITEQVPEGPGKARKARICQSALCRQNREPRRTSDRAVGRTLDEGRREWDEKQLPGKLSPSSASRSGSSNPDTRRAATTSIGRHSAYSAMTATALTPKDRRSSRRGRGREGGGGEASKDRRSVARGARETIKKGNAVGERVRGVVHEHHVIPLVARLASRARSSADVRAGPGRGASSQSPPPSTSIISQVRSVGPLGSANMTT